MKRFILVSFIVLSLHLALTDGGYNMQSSFEKGSGTYNVNEDVSLKCAMTADKAFNFDHEFKWFKQQGEEDFVFVARYENHLEPPFINNPDKYSVVMETDGGLPRNFYLRIKGVESADAGNYKCVLGVKKSETALAESSIIPLTITPGAPSIEFKAPKAPRDEKGVYEFDVGQQIRCSGQVTTNSKTIQAKMKLQDGTDITNSFIYTTNLEWNGEKGLKVPTTYFTLNTDSWAPAKAGSGKMSCHLYDSDRQLDQKDFQYTKKETATLNCTTNYKRPARVDDLNVYIMCKVYHYTGDMTRVTVKWSFLYDDDKVSMKTGETKHDRMTDYNAVDGYRLKIPRVNIDMVNTGKTFNYTALLYRKADDHAIAKTTYSLPVDPTGRVAQVKGSAIMNSQSTWLLVSLMVTLLLAFRF